MATATETTAPPADVLLYVYRTRAGAFWHLARPGLVGRASYVFTRCGRRLGRWNLVPARPRADVTDDAICLACRRKVAR